ncbi:hypothetical protein [Treponema putidum]|uniref:hypothetical protein n=2 Tax=Treponema putidum TaxID=221027 RepID=UPI002107384C|nr:hypothetical protein [Treponema putidum]UTY30362.1 hypothetical protein E4N75_01470 [Treponema putidum]
MTDKRSAGSYTHSHKKNAMSKHKILTSFAKIPCKAPCKALDTLDNAFIIFAASGKRQAASGKRQAASGKRQAASGKRQAA